MILKKITQRAELPAALHPLYLHSFPPEERRPWESIERLVETPATPFAIYVATDEATGQALGMATVWHLDGVDYVEHLMVETSLRGAGIGGEMVELLKENGHVPLLLEVEPADIGSDARRRINFYRRHGFRVVEGMRYIQPPYQPELPPVELLLMTTAPADDAAFDRCLPAVVARQLYRHVYGYTGGIPEIDSSLRECYGQ